MPLHARGEERAQNLRDRPLRWLIGVLGRRQHQRAADAQVRSGAKAMAIPRRTLRYLAARVERSRVEAKYICVSAGLGQVSRDKLAGS